MTGANFHLYLAAFAASAALDAFPALVPPPWAALVFFQVRFGLDIAAVSLVGALGSTLGRFALTCYLHRVARYFLDRHRLQNIACLGERLNQSPKSDFAFIFCYCLTPLSTSPLFLAAGLSGVRRRTILPPFFLGKLFGYSLILLAGKEASRDLTNLFSGHLSWKAAAVPVFGLGLVVAMLFIDWRSLLHDGRFRLDLRIHHGYHRSCAHARGTRARDRTLAT